MRRWAVLGFLALALATLWLPVPARRVDELEPAPGWYYQGQRYGWTGRWVHRPWTLRESWQRTGLVWASTLPGGGAGTGGTDTDHAWMVLGLGHDNLTKLDPADNSSYYIGIGTFRSTSGVHATDAAAVSVAVPMTATLQSAFWRVFNSGSTSATTISHLIDKADNTAHTAGVAFAWSANGINTGSETGLTLGFTAGQSVCGEIVTGVLADPNPTNNTPRVTLRFTTL